ncbi:hydrolase [Lactobacillus sp.] [Lactiplantibacillus mudanjiangensis]|uniref:alpha/beta hydrolase n=1 Tax=Lactiplantibacillus mudanjiangensis TaxID=1296538 RepID=UPI001015C939|nr:alpha/beta hydrolase [Lactiplantibacillus mudanjiangensis]VDG33069.1 hydrolase [Lactobacillus sp.] [Lactiplantibacillus mudanjiangensis]
MRRKRIIQSLAGISVGIVIGSGAYWQWRLAPLKATTVKMTNIPTVFVAGDYARAFSTNGFVHRLSSTHLMTKALVVNVAKNGHLTIKQWAPLRRNPTIQVIFADNHHPKRQAQQLAVVMAQLKRRYHITTYNAVGHSSGSNIIWQYLVNTAKQPQQPKIHKFVSIASTYPQVTSQLHQLPTKIPILNIGGQIWQTAGDGEVSLKGVLAFSQKLRQQGWQPKTVIMHGSPFTVEHSLLHINPAVDRQLVTFLYQ